MAAMIFILCPRLSPISFKSFSSQCRNTSKSNPCSSNTPISSGMSSDERREEIVEGGLGLAKREGGRGRSGSSREFETAMGD